MTDITPAGAHGTNPLDLVADINLIVNNPGLSRRKYISVVVSFLMSYLFYDKEELNALKVAVTEGGGL